MARTDKHPDVLICASQLLRERERHCAAVDCDRMGDGRRGMVGMVGAVDGDDGGRGAVEVRGECGRGVGHADLAVLLARDVAVGHGRAGRGEKVDA